LNRREDAVRSTLGLVVVLIATVIVLILSARQTRRDVDAVRSVNLAAGENVTPRTFDRAAADRMADRLRGLLSQPDLPLDELRGAAAEAAGWAAGLTPGTFEYHMAVNLRGAAGELLAASPALDDPHRARAKQLLQQAETAPGQPGGGPPGAVGGIKDQLQNLQQSHQEKLQEVEREKP
jgi:hypothetical protein